RALGCPDLIALFSKPLSERISDAQFIVNNQQLSLRFHESPPAGCGGNFSGRRTCLFLVPRQRYCESCASSNFRVHFNVSVVPLENAAADGEPEPNTFAGPFCCEEGFEQTGKNLWWDAAAVVANDDLDNIFFAAELGRDPQVPS